MPERRARTSRFWVLVFQLPCRRQQVGRTGTGQKATEKIIPHHIKRQQHTKQPQVRIWVVDSIDDDSTWSMWKTKLGLLGKRGDPEHQNQTS
jgi:hypothetical protein